MNRMMMVYSETLKLLMQFLDNMAGVIFTVENILNYTDFFSSFEPPRQLSFKIIVPFSLFCISLS